jgi:hypothetical protein
MSEPLTSLQWNINLTHEENPKRIASRLHVLQALVEKYGPTFVALQEAEHQDVEDAFPNTRYGLHDEIGLVTAFDQDYWYEPVVKASDSRYIVMRFHTFEAGKPDVILANLHARSQLNGGRDAPRGTLSNLQDELFYLRKASEYDAEEIIIGDCNLNPYDDFLTSEDALCAHRALANVHTQADTRTITYRPMYNPAWHLYGRREGALGTYYYSSPKHDAPWAVFDQAMVTSGIAYGGEDAVELVTEVGTHRLVKDPPKCIPDKEVGSDHLPLVVRFRHEVTEVGD